jgi:hypothetical protein
MKGSPNSLLVLASLAASLGLPPGSAAAQDRDTYRYEDSRLVVRLTPRSPNQVAAFYEARKFPDSMIDLLREQCFITVGVRNKGPEIVWLDLSQWRMEGRSGEVTRRTRPWLNERWDQMGAPMPSRSTLRWTLLPELLDFRPDEAEGGNIVLARQDEPFGIEARFDVGAERSGDAIVVGFEDVRCAQDAP